MKEYYLYLPFTLKNIGKENKEIKSWFYLKNTTKIEDFLSTIFNINKKLLVDENGNNLANKTGEQIDSWTNIFIVPKFQKIQSEPNFLKNFSIRYYKPSIIKEPAFIVNYLKRTIKDSEIPVTSERLRIKHLKGETYLLCKSIDEFSLYKYDENFKNLQRVKDFEINFFKELNVKGFSLLENKLLFYNSREIFYIELSSPIPQTLYLEPERKKTIEKLKIYGGKGLIFTKNEVNDTHSIKIFDLIRRKILNEIEMKKLGESISDFAVYGDKNYIISTEEGKIIIYEDNNIKSYKLIEERGIFPDKIILEMDDMNNLYILAGERVYITERNFYPKVSFKIEGANLLSVYGNIIVLHSKDNTIHRITLNPSIITNLVQQSS